MATHRAVVMVGIKKPLEIMEVPTVKPEGDEVRVRVEWTASTPLDLHQNDGGLLVSRYPFIHYTLSFFASVRALFRRTVLERTHYSTNIPLPYSQLVIAFGQLTRTPGHPPATHRRRHRWHSRRSRALGQAPQSRRQGLRFYLALQPGEGAPGILHDERVPAGQIARGLHYAGSGYPG